MISESDATPECTGETTNVLAVKAALARLANAGDRPDPTESPAAVVDEAAGATGRLTDAAAFVRADGRERLETAVERLRDRDRTVTADRGAAVLSALAAFRTAAAGRSSPDDDPSPDGADDGEATTTSTPLSERI